MTVAIKIIMFIVCFGFVLGFAVMNPDNNPKAPAGFITPEMKDTRSNHEKWQEAYEWQRNRKK